MTLAEIFTLKDTPAILERTFGALILVSHDVLSESPTSQARQDWARATIAANRSIARQYAAYALAANRAATVEEVLDAPDTAYLNNMADAVDAIIGVPDAP